MTSCDGSCPVNGGGVYVTGESARDAFSRTHAPPARLWLGHRRGCGCTGSGRRASRTPWVLNPREDRPEHGRQTHRDRRTGCARPPPPITIAGSWTIRPATWVNRLVRGAEGEHLPCVGPSEAASATMYRTSNGNSGFACSQVAPRTRDPTSPGSAEQNDAPEHGDGCRRRVQSEESAWEPGRRALESPHALRGEGESRADQHQVARAAHREHAAAGGPRRPQSRDGAYGAEERPRRPTDDHGLGGVTPGHGSLVPQPLDRLLVAFQPCGLPASEHRQPRSPTRPRGAPWRARSRLPWRAAPRCRQAGAQSKVRRSRRPVPGSAGDDAYRHASCTTVPEASPRARERTGHGRGREPCRQQAEDAAVPPRPGRAYRGACGRTVRRGGAELYRPRAARIPARR